MLYRDGPQVVGNGALTVQWAAGNGDQVYLGMTAGALAEIGRHATAPTHPTVAQLIVVPSAQLQRARYLAIAVECEKVVAGAGEDESFAFATTSVIRAWMAGDETDLAFANVSGTGSGNRGPYIVSGSGTGAYHHAVLFETLALGTFAAVGAKRLVYLPLQQIGGASQAGAAGIGSIGCIAYTILLIPNAVSGSGKVAKMNFTLKHYLGR